LVTDVLPYHLLIQADENRVREHFLLTLALFVL
jgi:hypothetical protein